MPLLNAGRPLEHATHLVNTLLRKTLFDGMDGPYRHHEILSIQPSDTDTPYAIDIKVRQRGPIKLQPDSFYWIGRKSITPG